jgi:hypothetical protein
LVNKQWNNSPLPCIFYLKNSISNTIDYLFIHSFIYVVSQLPPHTKKNMMGLPHAAVEQTEAVEQTNTHPKEN